MSTIKRAEFEWGGVVAQVIRDPKIPEPVIRLTDKQLGGIILIPQIGWERLVAQIAENLKE